MKTVFSILTFLFWGTMAFGQEAIIGKFYYEVPAGDQMVKIFVDINEDNTFSMDSNGDNKPEVEGTFTVEGNQFTMQANPDCECCTGKGVYTFKEDNGNIIINMVSDECESRRISGPMTLYKR